MRGGSPCYPCPVGPAPPAEPRWADPFSTMDARDPRSPNTTLGVLGLVVALLAGFALLPRVFAPREAAIVGRQAPDFRLGLVANGAALGVDNGSLSLGELRGRAVLLDFWATWCGPCRTEAAIVDQVSRRWRDRGVVVIGVDTDTPDQGDPGDFVLRHGLSYPIVRDATGQTSRSYDVDSLPTLVVVSRSGEIIAVRTGITDDAELERLLLQAL
jgi:cytochrome c biogenesis protein CcmG/thiol:disulfide interchange protein DsbE